jgi:hypothetical protein
MERASAAATNQARGEGRPGGNELGLVTTRLFAFGGRVRFFFSVGTTIGLRWLRLKSRGIAFLLYLGPVLFQPFRELYDRIRMFVGVGQVDHLLHYGHRSAVRKKAIVYYHLDREKDTFRESRRFSGRRQRLAARPFAK